MHLQVSYVSITIFFNAQAWNVMTFGVALTMEEFLTTYELTAYEEELCLA